MEMLSDKPKSLIATIIVAAMALAYVFLFFLPGQQAIGELRSQLTTKQQYISQSQRTKLAINEAERKLTLAQQFTRDFRSAASSEDDSESFIGTLTEAASLSGVSNLRLDPQVEVQMRTISRSTIHIECEGTFASIFEFIRSLESMPPVIWVSDINFEAAIRTESGISKEKRVDSKDGEISRVVVTLSTFADKAEISD